MQKCKIVQLVYKSMTLGKSSVDKVTNVRHLAELDTAQVSSPTTKVLVRVVDSPLRIYYTLPVTSATAERTFSAVRRLRPT